MTDDPLVLPERFDRGALPPIHERWCAARADGLVLELDARAVQRIDAAAVQWCVMVCALSPGDGACLHANEVVRAALTRVGAGPATGMDVRSA